MTDHAQLSDTVLLVRPAGFGFHAEAARSNAFASDGGGDVAAAALAEFEALREALEEAGVCTIVLDDAPDAVRPDAVFPNNWVSFHEDGSVILYPMATKARRLERRFDAVAKLLTDRGFAVRRTIDLTGLEDQGLFLEGTGSLLFDRASKRAFASLSPRTHEAAVRRFDEAMGYSTFVFDSADRRGKPVYHTNVLMSLGPRFALLCREAVAPADLARLEQAVEDRGREIVPVSLDQMERFACNVIALRSRNGEPLIALSATALEALSPAQRSALERLGGELVAVPVPTIERVGGGSVRCMIADVHLPSA